MTQADETDIQGYFSDEEMAAAQELWEIGQVSEYDHPPEAPEVKPSGSGYRSQPPTASAGGPYYSHLDVPVVFDGTGSSDDVGIVSYVWDFGDGTTGTGSNPIHTYTTAPEPYQQSISRTVTLTVQDGDGQTAVSYTVVSLNTEPLAICVPWQFQGLTEVPHSVWYQNITNGTQTNAVRLKGVAKGIYTPLTYTWDFGDGTSAGPYTVSNKYIIEATHTYSDVSAGQPIIATLTITDALGHSSSDHYYLIVEPKTLDVEANIAIDEGLWFIHKQQNKATGSWVYNYGARDNDSFENQYRDTRWEVDYSSATASSLHAFEIHGHKETGDMRQNPYSETVLLGLRFLFTQITAAAISSQTAGDPDTNGNGLGIQVSFDRPPYPGGAVIDAIAASGTPDAIVQTGAANIRDRTYRDIVIDMCDMYAYGQAESGGYRGGWRYGWNGDSDNSVCQWAAIGMSAAEDFFGVTIPDFVRTENIIWLNYSYNTTYGTFGYDSSAAGGHGWYNTTASAMVQLAFDQLTTDDPKWIGSENYFANNWASFTSSNQTYAFYAFAKAMRLAYPNPVVTLRATGKDWYNDPVDGLKRKLVDFQGTNGSWGVGNWPYAGSALTTPWCVIILTSTLFTVPPVAVISFTNSPANEVYWEPVTELCLSAEESYHLDSNRQIVSYEWDFNGDGNFDDCTGIDCCYSWEEFGDYNVGLRVTDDNLPPQSDTTYCMVHIVPPPHAPIAIIDGPYVGTAGIPLLIDASSSFDLDPGDYITEFWWDLDGAPYGFDTLRGGPELATINHVFSTPGIYRIGVRVWDNGVFNDGVKMQDDSYSTVEILAPIPAIGNFGIALLLSIFGVVFYSKHRHQRR